MNVIFKESMEDDCRALKEEFFNKLLYGGILQPFVELVSKDERLEMCFRGNAKSNQTVSIYYKNHQMLKIYDTGKLEFNYNHVRYCPEEKEKEYRTKLKEFGFVINDKYNSKGEKDIEYVTRTMRGKEILTLNKIEVLVNDVLIPMFDDFFDVNMTYDYFKNAIKKSKGELAEKIDQQILFTKMKNSKNGFFFYDMEIAKKHENKVELQNDKFNNKADMMAVEFDSNGNPITLLFVEVKSKKSAFAGKSGLNEHINKMKMITEEEFKNRKKEAFKVINQYHQLGLRKVDCIENCCYDKMMQMEKGMLIVLSREAIGYWEKYEKSSPYKFEKCFNESNEFSLYRVIDEIK